MSYRNQAKSTYYLCADVFASPIAGQTAAAAFRAQNPEFSPGGKPGPGGHTTARVRAGIPYSEMEQVATSLQFLAFAILLDLAIDDT